MGRTIAWLFIILGGVIIGFNGYKWWDEINIAIKDPKLAMNISDDWQSTTEEPSLSSVENFFTETNDETGENTAEMEEIKSTKEKAAEEETESSHETTDNNQQSFDQQSYTNDGNQSSDNTNNPSSNNKKTTSNQVVKQVGELIIPKIGAYLPVMEGTDDESLSKGVGRYIGYGTVTPDQTGHVVVSGHRDTVFRKTGQLKEGDKVYFRYQGYIYTYQIRTTWITHADDRTVIVPIAKPVLSITTCYPFDFVGNAPDRYIIRADLIKIQKDS